MITPSLTTRPPVTRPLRAARIALALVALPVLLAPLQFSLERASRVRVTPIRHSSGSSQRLVRTASTRAHIELPAPSDVPYDEIDAAAARAAADPAAPQHAALPSRAPRVRRPAPGVLLASAATPVARRRPLTAVSGRGPPRV